MINAGPARPVSTRTGKVTYNQPPSSCVLRPLLLAKCDMPISFIFSSIFREPKYQQTSNNNPLSRYNVLSTILYYSANNIMSSTFFYLNQFFLCDYSKTVLITGTK